jgi:hypothetical protein
MKRILVSLLLSTTLLTACDRTDLVVWSPDGNRVAIIASNSLRVGDESGKLSAPVLDNAKFCRWLPDSIHVVVVSTKETTSWKDVKDLLSTSEQKSVPRIAEKVWKLGSLPDPKSSLDRLHQSEAHGATPVGKLLKSHDVIVQIASMHDNW